MNVAKELIQGLGEASSGSQYLVFSLSRVAFAKSNKVINFLTVLLTGL